MSEHIEIGVLGRPHGIKGEIRVIYYADSVDLLRGPLFLRDGNGTLNTVEIISLRLVGGDPVVCFKGYENRTAAEHLRGYTVLIPRSVLPELREGEVYLEDLVGFTVIDDMTGRTIGTLSHFLFTTDPEVWSIRTPDDKEFLFPAASEFICKYDLERRTIFIAPPDGLYDVYGIVP